MLGHAGDARSRGGRGRHTLLRGALPEEWTRARLGGSHGGGRREALPFRLAPAPGAARHHGLRGVRAVAHPLLDSVPPVPRSLRPQGGPAQPDPRHQTAWGHIFILYPDDENGVNGILRPYLEAHPPLVAREQVVESDVEQRFWVVDDPQVIDAIVKEMAPKRNLIIADGHHRYETALNFRDEMWRKYPDAPANAAFNYTMVTLVSMSDPGLVILPTHRLIHSYGQMGGPEARERARDYFEVTTVADRGAMERALAEATPDHPRFGFYDGAYAVLELRDPGVLERLLPDRAPDWRLLDVTVLHELFIERVLGIDKAAVERKENINYLRDPGPGYEAVDRGEAQFLLLMNPTRIEQVRACTAASERMPQKSTDFYPKVISGLVALPVGPEERL
ncbi:MAG TPA: DUF1015 domain-containing protein [Anaerolineae bacterium]|nr:DUF1015 domain-containing protein [Anaerolineae bacterium]